MTERLLRNIHEEILLRETSRDLTVWGKRRSVAASLSPLIELMLFPRRERCSNVEVFAKWRISAREDMSLFSNISLVRLPVSD